VEVQVILHKYDLPHRFSPGATKEAQTLALQPLPREAAGRIDLREVPTFTIDGEKARDFDDAVSIVREADGSFKLYVSISDVSHYVKEAAGCRATRGQSSTSGPRHLDVSGRAVNEICCLHPRWTDSR
jgi:ribonuclease R